MRDAVFVLCKLRIGIAHRAIEIVDHPMEERFFLPQLVAVTDCAANDPPQHVSATFTARNDAIDDQERARADVIGDDLERRAVAILRTRFARGSGDQIDKEIDLVVRMNVLQYRGKALEAETRVDAGPR